MNQIKRTRQWNEMTLNSAVGISRAPAVAVLLILKHLQEERGKEFCRAFHLHVQEAAGMAGANHS